MSGHRSRECESFVALLQKSFVEVCKKASGKELIVVEVESAKESSFPTMLLVCEAIPELQAALCLDLPAIHTLAQTLLGEEFGGEATENPDSREAALELIRQIAGQISTDAKPLLAGAGLRAKDVASNQPQLDWVPSVAIHFHLKYAELESLGRISVLLNEGFVAQLAKTPESHLTPAAPVAVVDCPESNLQLVMDVALPVILRFGQRKMTLREIMQLNSGSVIELDSKAADAVDLLLDDRVVARGDVVVVDGNYGLRVTEVAGG